jgi:hypothetical protein
MMSMAQLQFLCSKSRLSSVAIKVPQQPRPSGPQHEKTGLRTSGAARRRHQRGGQRQAGVVRTDAVLGGGQEALGANKGTVSSERSKASKRASTLARERAGAFVGSTRAANRLFPKP